MKDKIIHNKKVIIATISIFIFLIILRNIYKYEIASYDTFAYNLFVEDLRNNNLTLIMKFITALGSGIVLIAIVILMFLLYKNKRETLLAAINLGTITLLNNIVKIIIKRPRPIGYRLVTENSYSFPSGHSMISTAFYGLIIYLIYKNVKDKRKKYLYIILLFILIISICISRIYLGVHYLSDTAGGFFLAITYLMIFISLIPKEKKDTHEKKKNKN